MHWLTRIRRMFVTSFPVKFIIRKSKRIYLPGFHGIPLFDVVNFFYKQTQKTSLTERAASIAFSLLMAIPPACIFLFTLVPYLPIDGFIDELHQVIRDVIPGEKNNAALIKFLDDFTGKQRNDLLSFGIILALFFSSNAMMGIMQSFNKDYIGFRKRNTLQERIVALKLTMILFVLFILSIIALVTRGVVLTWLGIENPTVRAIIFNARWLVLLLLFFFAISFIFRHAPAVHKKWRLINPGSLLATFLMIGCTMLFSWWVVNFGNYNQLYGSIGTILIVMLLIYFNSMVLLIGFELNVSISSLRKIADQRKNSLADGKDSA